MEEDLKVKLERSVDVCRVKVLKVNADKSKVMVLGDEERLECEVLVHGTQLEHVSEFKYLGVCFGRIRKIWCRMS